MKSVYPFLIILLLTACQSSGSDKNVVNPVKNTTGQYEEHTDLNPGSANRDEEHEDLYEQEDDSLILVSDQIKTILNAVFKETSVLVAEQVTNNEGIYENIDILSTKLRGQYASIPLSRCMMTIFDHIAVLAFEVYLSDEKQAYKTYLEDEIEPGNELAYAAALNKGKNKLIQAIVYDLSTNTFLGKPNDFPIEQDFWEIEAYGDAVSNISISQLLPITNSPGAALIYTDYLVDSHENMIIIKPVQDQILSSKLIATGDLGGLSGCDIWVEYSDLTATDSSVTALKKQAVPAQSLTFAPIMALLKVSKMIWKFYWHGKTPAG